MALINCPECSKGISSSTKKCPNCGFDFQFETKRKYKKLIIGIIVSVAVIVIGILIYDACTTSTEELKEQLDQYNHEIDELEDDLDDLYRKKAYNDYLIDKYE